MFLTQDNRVYEDLLQDPNITSAVEARWQTYKGNETQSTKNKKQNKKENKKENKNKEVKRKKQEKHKKHKEKEKHKKHKEKEKSAIHLTMASGSVIRYVGDPTNPDYSVDPPGVHGIPHDASTGSRVGGWPDCEDGAAPTAQVPCKPPPKTSFKSDMSVTYSKITMCKKLSTGELKCAVRKIIYNCFIVTTIEWFGWEIAWELAPFSSNNRNGTRTVAPNKIQQYVGPLEGTLDICEGAQDAMWIPRFVPMWKPFKTEATTSEYLCSTLPAKLVASAVV